MRSADDLTAVARIRDAAIEQFGEHGFGVGLRSIAEAAGVSAGAGHPPLRFQGRSAQGLRRLRRRRDPRQQDRVHAIQRPGNLVRPDGRDRGVRAADGLPGAQHADRRRTGEDVVAHHDRQRREYIDEGVSAGTLKPSRDPAARARYLAITGGGGFLLYIQMHDNPNRFARGAARLRPGHGAARPRALHRGPADRPPPCTTHFSLRTARSTQTEGTNASDSIERHRNPGSDKEFRLGPGTGRPGPDGRRRRGARLPRPQRRGKVDHHPHPARPGARRRGHGPACSAATRGPTRCELHRQIAYVPGDVTLWPTLTGGETIDLLARMRGGIDDKRRAELIERFELDPHKKARTYSKGQPAEGLADLRVLLARPAAAARRTQQRPGPVDGERLSAMRRRGPRPRRNRPAVQPHPGRDRSAVRTGDDHPRPAGPSRPARWIDAAPHPHLDHRRNDRQTRRSQSHPRCRGRQHRRNHAAGPGRQRWPRRAHQGAR